MKIDLRGFRLSGSCLRLRQTASSTRAYDTTSTPNVPEKPTKRQASAPGSHRCTVLQEAIRQWQELLSNLVYGVRRRSCLTSPLPAEGFASLDAARAWVQGFMAWYNEEHRHSRIGFVTPGERHRGEDKALLAKRHEVYQAAREANPARWRGQTRNWTPVGTVMLNPERPEQEQKLAA
ncbi:integrase core domain-containing protein [Aeromonas veronii]